MKRGFLAVLLCLACPLAARDLSAVDVSKPPTKLSDLYKFLTLQVRDGLSSTVKVWPIRLQGRAKEILGQGDFFEVEMTLKPFDFQDLSFEKGEILIKQLTVDPDAMKHWQLKIKDYKEVQNRLIFTLRSLEAKLSKTHGDLKLRADSAERTVEILGHGHFCFIPLDYVSRAGLRWDEKGKKLYFVPKSVSWAGFHVPLWLAWLGSRTIPEEPLLDLSSSWIPVNIQEIYVGWDRINLSTNW
jgi:hypothetical protein